MKKYLIEISPRAFNDLERVSIDVYNASRSESVTAKYLNGIAQEIESLHQMPERFPLWKDNLKYRFLLVKKYLVFFKVESGVVRVAHVRYVGRKPFRI